MKSIPISKLVMGFAIVTLVAGVASFAYATITDAEITACVSKSTGYIRIIGDKSRLNKCLKGEYQLTWNMQGIQGEPGEDGVDGETGPEGPKGEPGESNWNEERIALLEARIAELEGDDNTSTTTSTTTDPYEATLQISLSPNNPDSSTIVVDETDNSEAVSILVFETEAIDGDVFINSLAIRIETPGADILKVIHDTEIIVDGQTFGKDYVRLLSPESALYFFDTSSELTVEEDDSVSVELLVSFNGKDGNYQNQQTIQASVTASEYGVWEADGSDDLSQSDFSGTAVGEVHSLLSGGIFIPFDSVNTETDTQGENNTIGEFTLEFEVTAVEGDYYITDNSTQVGNTPTNGVAFIIDGPGTTTVSSVLGSTADEDTSGVFTVPEGETETFTLTVTIDPSMTGQYRVTLGEVWYSSNPNGITGADKYVPLPAEDFRTNYQNINAN